MAQITLNSSGVASSGSLLLQTNGTTTQATIDTSGNLGLGVTPSAWGAGSTAFQLGNGGIWKSGSRSVDWMVNGYHNGTNYIYNTSNAATYYRQYDGQHQWYNAASGTAGNAITFTQAMTLDASGNLLVGLTSAGSVARTQLKANSNAEALALVSRDADNNCELHFRDSSNATTLARINTPGSASLAFSTNGSERARIDSSGSLLVGTTSVPSASSGGAALQPDTSGRTTLKLGTTTTSSITLASFWNPNGAVGTIQTSGSSTAYNTSSDYRLKENIAPMTGALAKVSALKPCTYTWKVDGSSGEGFIAHELQEVVAGCVSGEKDAVDENGNPVYQGIDTSFLVATLTAAIQELNAKFEAYKAAHP